MFSKATVNRQNNTLANIRKHVQQNKTSKQKTCDPCRQEKKPVGTLIVWFNEYKDNTIKVTLEHDKAINAHA